MNGPGNLRTLCGRLGFRTKIKIRIGIEIKIKIRIKSGIYYDQWSRPGVPNMYCSIPAAREELLGVVWVIHNTKHLSLLQHIFTKSSSFVIVLKTWSFKTLSVCPSVRFGFFDLVNIDATLIFFMRTAVMTMKMVLVVRIIMERRNMSHLRVASS